MCGMIGLKNSSFYKDNPKEGEVILIGFMERLEISFASYGGWISLVPKESLQSQWVMCYMK
jgi:hypothetical protein